MIEAADAPPWCGRCGHAATFAGATIDPRRPFVTCGRRGSKGRGCGRVVGTYGYHEAHAASVRWRRRFATAMHIRHGRYEWTDLYCDGCAAAGWVHRPPDFGTMTSAKWAEAGARSEGSAP